MSTNEPTDTDRHQKLAGILDDYVAEHDGLERDGRDRLLIVYRRDPRRPDSIYHGEWVAGADCVEWFAQVNAAAEYDALAELLEDEGLEVERDGGGDDE